MTGNRIHMGFLHWVDPDDESAPFPNVEQALREPDGLLAVGGDLAPGRLMSAYRRGIFPWYGPEQPILWWSPDPRAVLIPERVHISRSLRRTLNSGRLSLSMDTVFAQVVQACAAPRPDQPGTWITRAMAEAYVRLHEQLGTAHSIEVWQDGRLVGGLYGIALGRVFYGESMFSQVTDASKVALVVLARQLQRWGFAVIDCQVQSGHLARMGAETIPRSQFTQLLDQWCEVEDHPGPWALEPQWVQPRARDLVG